MRLVRVFDIRYTTLPKFEYQFNRLVQHSSNMIHILRLRVVLGPKSNKLFEVMRTEY